LAQLESLSPNKGIFGDTLFKVLNMCCFEKKMSQIMIVVHECGCQTTLQL
jgi:hypothetical protein